MGHMKNEVSLLFIALLGGSYFGERAPTWWRAVRPLNILALHRVALTVLQNYARARTVARPRPKPVFPLLLRARLLSAYRCGAGVLVVNRKLSFSYTKMCAPSLAKE